MAQNREGGEGGVRWRRVWKGRCRRNAVDTMFASWGSLDGLALCAMA